MVLLYNGAIISSGNTFVAAEMSSSLRNSGNNGTPRMDSDRKSEWIDWLARSSRCVFASQNDWWWLHRKSLIPASIIPRPCVISDDEAQELLERSGAWLLRYSSRTFARPAEFWWMACDRYTPDTPSKKARNQIRRAYKSCTVKPITTEYLRGHAYPCYQAAFTRYQHAKPVSVEEFANAVRSQADGPFERWGVFVGEDLAGFGICCIEGAYAALVGVKLHPEFLTYYPAYALIDTLLQHYVAASGRVLSNGYRAISHDTEFQDFLLKFGFLRHYCDLKVVYRPGINLLVRAAYPFRKMLKVVPESKHTDAARALLFQESICRSFR